MLRTRRSFTDRVVVITGGAGGVGAALARELAKEGAKVALLDRDRAGLDVVLAQLPEGRAMGVEVDVTDEPSCVAAMEEVRSAWGGIDVLINNAGIAYPTPFEEMTPERWKTMLDVHVDGSYTCSHAAWPYMVKQGFGRLLFTSSPFGLYAAASFAHYSAAKAAMLGLSKALALEGQDHNIHANAVAPFSASRMTGRTNDEQANSPFGPRYLAQLAIWLSHSTTAETGSVFEVGGGYVHRVRNELSRGLHLPDEQHTAENIAARADVLNDFSESIHPPLGESWTIGKDVFGDEWSEKF